jgi:peptide/nickel transport system permease protein
MTRFIVRRLLQMLPTIAGVVLITFILFNLVGGSPASMMLGDKASASALEAFDEERGFNRPLFWGRTGPTRIYSETDLATSAGAWASVEGVVWREGAGLEIAGPAEVAIPLNFDPPAGQRFEWRVDYRDQPEERLQEPVIRVAADETATVTRVRCLRVYDDPWRSQFSHYLGQLLRLDLGRSHTANRSVVDMLKEGIGPTLMLATPILLGETIISVALALGCAYYRNRFYDRLILFVCVLLMSVNYLVWIVAGQYWLAYRWELFPVWGFASWSYVLLPVLIGIAHGLGPNVRFYRAVMLEEMHKDYVRTAKAKGLSPRVILFRHVLKNAMIPVITNVVLSIPFLYTGSLLLETFFGIPGLGYLSVNAINSSDVDVVRAVVLIGSMLYLVANLLADLAYAWVDPRVKLS